MTNVAACLVVALIMAFYAYYKGRTGWHWFALSFLAFGVIWLFTVVALDFAAVRVSLGADPKLAVFVGALTCLIVLITLASVPARPRRRLETARRDPSR